MADDSAPTYEMQHSGPNADDYFDSVLEELENVSNLSGFSVELNGDVDGLGSESEPGEAATDVIADTAEAVTDGSGESADSVELVSFGDDSATATAAMELVDLDEFARTSEVRDEFLDDADVPQDRVSQVLWQLADRDVLDVRDDPDDKRMNQYRMTELGRQSVQQLS